MAVLMYSYANFFAGPLDIYILCVYRVYLGSYRGYGDSGKDNGSDFLVSSVSAAGICRIHRRRRLPAYWPDKQS